MKKWYKDKEEYLAKLKEAIYLGLVDKDIIYLLFLINRFPYYYTTSSCSGRIQCSSSHIPGLKGEMDIIGKWHQKITVDKVVSSLIRERIKIFGLLFIP